MISSAGNSQIKNLNKLQKSSKARKEQGVFLVEGIKMFLEAKKLNLIEKAYLSEDLYLEWSQTVSLGDIPYEIVDNKVFKEISDTITPQGIIAVVRRNKFYLEDILQKKTLRLMFLENIRDPGNLGTIVRTAEGAGVTAIILSKESVDLYNPKVVRSTMGSIFRMPFIYTEDFLEAMKQAQAAGVKLYATHLKGKVFYDEVEYGNKAGIVIGNEANGISDEAANQADTYVKIPMCGHVESLNAGVAASIMMYEMLRQGRKL